MIHTACDEYAAFQQQNTYGIKMNIYISTFFFLSFPLFDPLVDFEFMKNTGWNKFNNHLAVNVIRVAD